MNEDWGVTNAQEYTVSELSGALKRAVEDQFGFVKVRAELSGVKHAASGHLYFGLKDDKSVLDGVCWRGQAQRLSFRPEDGLEVVCTGKLTTYGARSKYQMVVEQMEPAGAGALMALLDERRKKLAAEGLFDESRKQTIPFLPRIIGVITSPTGAVIQDILHRLSDRFPRRVVVWPVLVQGEGAAAQIAAAVEGFNSADNHVFPKPDLLIVARGGGSIEDLWAFNEEVVVRAVAASNIPIISAVGHETDTTLVDFVSDLRAPTPTAAAEKAVPVRDELEASMADYGRRMLIQRRGMIDVRREKLQALSRALPKPQDIVGTLQQRYDDLADRLPKALMLVAERKRNILQNTSAKLSANRLRQGLAYKEREFKSLIGRLTPSFERNVKNAVDHLAATARVLDTLSYQRVLERGFALVEDVNGHSVTSATALAENDMFKLRFHDGERTAFIGTEDVPQAEVVAATKSKVKNVKTPSKSRSDDRQGKLL
ncbi:exodeoxyribonuclease VII large subunit [Kordiimonas aquimaris]|uniref:exodeoxyribonuclease VII large subunit n=1 Tax=Kordiimonas aquimaris TaxID=707591 RepID=UPI0021CEC99F|nr:exodeoxyribonuclease VII large subunit [Kordiimonas aquimaris]